MVVHLYPAGRAIRRPHVERKTAELFYIHYKLLLIALNKVFLNLLYHLQEVLQMVHYL